MMLAHRRRSNSNTRGIGRPRGSSATNFSRPDSGIRSDDESLNAIANPSDAGWERDGGVAPGIAADPRRASRSRTDAQE